jgi:hypothetical protein
MRKIQLVILFILGISVQLGLSQELTNEQNRKFFVQGISVTNTITLNNPTPEVDKVLFYSIDSTNQTIDKYIDSVSTDGFNWTLDMGQLAPKSSIYAQMIIGYDYEGDSIPLKELTIIKRPDWLEKGSVANISVNGSDLSFEGRYPIYEYNYFFDDNVKMLGGRKLGVVGEFVFKTKYNLTDGVGTVEDNFAQIDIDVLNYSNIKEQINYGAELTMDKNLNISIFASKEFKSKSVNWDSPEAKFPVCPGFNVSFSASIEFYATLKGQIVIGQKDGKFGFIEDGQNRKTKIIGVVTGIGTVRGGVSVFGGVAKATASLTAKANLGAGFEYVSLPATNSRFLYGGDFDLTGSVEINLLESRLLKWFGVNPINVYSGYSQLYYTSFGDTTALRGPSINHYDPIFNTTAFTVEDTGSLNLPEFKPQPTFASFGEKLFATWINVEGENYQVLLSSYDKLKNEFVNTTIIRSDDFAKSNPKIGVLSDGSVLVTWTQLRYNKTNVPKNVNMETLIKAQDIWFAFYDAEKDTIIETSTIKDNSTNLSDGRAEGQASISVGSNKEAMITWVSLNENQTSSDIWFSSLTKNGTDWEMTDPSKLIDISGTNSDVNVIYGDSSVAIAVWINDPDGDAATNDEQIVYAQWDGENWGTSTSVIADNPGNVDYNNLSLSSNYGKIAMAYTSAIDDTINISNLNLEVFDIETKTWDSSASFQDTSEVLTYQCPQTSISSDGFVSVAYQVIDKYNTADNIDNGELYLYVKDLNKNEEWKEITQNTNLCDTSTFIWDMTAGFGPDNQYYVMTQEYNDNGPVKNPHKGIMFGDPDLSMVLRGLKVNNDLSISDIDEPDTKTTRLTQLEVPKSRLNAIYPNPFEQFTTIEFSLYEPSKVQLEVYNYTGSKVATLIDSKLGQGMYKTNFDAGNLPEGIYYTKLTVDGQTSVSKMVLIK